MQYHGGTNFGRTSSSFVMTRYYDEAPLDEFGELGPWCSLTCIIAQIVGTIDDIYIFRFA